ncbi:MAG: hypothetical protein FJY55_07020 [Betaproteobacteria bacterium]|nr:hypothetical protein [Betaproteobacteria bacterium]
MKLTLGISVPDGGTALLELLLESAALPQSGGNDVAVHCTCHGEEQRQLLLDSSFALPIERVHVVPRETAKFMHHNSVTHSRCINALYAGKADGIAVLCDFDGAFVLPDWDEVLVEQIERQKLAFFGAPYSDLHVVEFSLPAGNIRTMKYQGKPNCILIAYSPEVIRPLSSVLCTFEALYGDPRAIAIRFIATPADSEIFGMPVGSFALLHTGTRVAEMIAQHRLRYGVLERTDSCHRVLRIPDDFADCPNPLRPEEYSYGGQPFFVHFRKGTRKSGDSSAHHNYRPEDFARDVRLWLRRTGGTGT